MKPLLHEFDYHWTNVVQSWPETLRPLMKTMTLIGQPVFTVGIGVLAIGFGLGRSNIALTSAGAVVVATISIGALIKIVLRRNRPVNDYVAKMFFKTYSLPSGHAVGATVAYGLLAYLEWQAINLPWNYGFAGLIAIFAVLIGVSRIYLGAHFPSDVIAGWLLGIVGVGLIIFVIQPVL